MTLQIPSLPSSGASPRGIGSDFRPNLSTGTGNYSVALDLPRAQAGFRPELALSYSSGQGQGEFGQGWSLNGPVTISRSTRRGPPDLLGGGAEVFALNGADDLVETGSDDAGYPLFAPRTQTMGWRIRKTAEAWEVTTQDGTIYRCGTSRNSRITDPTTGTSVSWLLSEIETVTGQTAVLDYLERGAHRFLRHIRYAPFGVEFCYEDRPDPFRMAQFGFPLQEDQRCTAITVTSDRAPTGILRRYDLAYAQSNGSGVSRLSQVTQSGGDVARPESFPSLDFGYSDWSQNAVTLTKLSFSGATAPDLRDQQATVIDLDGRGLPGILQGAAAGWLYWRNEGQGTYAAPVTPPTVPVGVTLDRASMAVADMEGNGTADLLRLEAGASGYYSNAAGGDFQGFVPYASVPPISASDPEVRFFDIDADGVVDAMRSTPTEFVLFRNKGRDGWDPTPQRVTRISDRRLFPDVNLSSPDVFFADMSGDGLQDIVQIRETEIAYWPYFGNGRWGHQILMDNLPAFPAGFDPQNVSLLDVDADGLADLVYVETGTVHLWRNCQGRRWADPVTIDLPPIAIQSVSVLDVMGNGRPALMLFGADIDGGLAPVHYALSFTQSDIPNLLSEIRTALGHVTKIAYSTSTEDLIAAEKDGAPWTTFAPFPVPVCRSIENTDMAAGIVHRREYRYREGHYCGIEREFCGFAQVDEIEAETETGPARRLRTVFHIGTDPSMSEDDRRGLPLIDRLKERALRGSPLATELWEETPAGPERLRQSSRSTWGTRIEAQTAETAVIRPFMDTMFQDDFAEADAARRQLWTYDAPDENGNPTRVTTAFGRHDPRAGFVAEFSRTERSVYAENPMAQTGRWIPGRLAARVVTDSDGQVLAAERWRYDGPAFDGLPLGKVDRGLVTRHEELVYADGQDDVGPDPIKRGLVHINEPHTPAGWYRCKERKSYDAQGNIAVLRDAFRNEARFRYDADGVNLIETVDAAGLVTAITYDLQVELPNQITKASGQIERRDYDTLGRAIAGYRTHSDGTLTLATATRFEPAQFDTTGALTRPTAVTTFLTRRAGLVASDLLARPARTTEDAFVTCRYYSSSGLELATITSTDPDEDGRARTRRSPALRFDTLGRKFAESHPVFADDFEWSTPAPGALEAYRLHFDGIGAVTRIDSPAATRKIDVAPWTIATQDPMDVSTGRAPSSVISFNSFGLAEKVLERVDATTTAEKTLSYHPDGTLHSIADTDGRVLGTYTQDRTGNRTRVAHREAGTHDMHYDAMGRLSHTRNPLGETTDYRYDPIGRLISVTVQDAQGTQIDTRRFHYDSINDGIPEQPTRLIAIDENGMRTRLTYDLAGRLVEKTREEGTQGTLRMRYEYDFLGNLSSITYPNGKEIHYGYNPAGQVTSIEGVYDNISYSARGAPLSLRAANGVTTTLQFDDDERLATLQVATAQEVHFSEGLTYDLNGNVSVLTERLGPGPERTLRHSYDRANRLTEIQEIEPTTAATFSLTYDPEGNISRNDQHRLADIAYDPTQRNLLMSLVPGETRRYDAAGRTIATQNLPTLDYDGFNRLRRAVHRDGRRSEFLFDHQGNRTRRTTTQGGQVRIVQIVDDSFERRPEGDRIIIRGPTGVAAILSFENGSETIEFCHSDHLGSIRCRTDATGALTDQAAFTAFGQSRGGAPQSLFTGKIADDDLGLIQMGQRFYEPASGRFLTPDPLLVERPEAAGPAANVLNPFSYAANNPTRNVDPTGRFPILAGIIIGVVVGAALGAAAAKENGEDPLVGGLIGGLVGGIVGWASLLGPAMIGAGMGAITSRGDNIWTGAAIGFVFGAVGGAAGRWMPVISGDSGWAMIGNFFIEVGKDALVAGLSAGTHAAVNGQDFGEAFESGALAGALYSAVLKIAFFGVLYDPKSGNPDVVKETQKIYKAQGKLDKGGFYSDTVNKYKMPDIDSVTIRRGGLLTATGHSHAVGVNQVSLAKADLVKLSKGKALGYEVFAHELRHIAQQRVAHLRWLEFGLAWVFRTGKDYVPGSIETPYSTYKPPPP